MSVVAFPAPEGGPLHSMSRLAEVLDAGATGVLLIVIRDGRPWLSLHGEMQRTDLAYVGALCLQWSVETDEATR